MSTLVRGPDYSNWSGRVDLASVRSAGFLVAGFKATEKGYVDPTFRLNWITAERVGLSRIAYCFGHADYGSSPEQQADQFLAVVRAAGGWHPWDIPCLDIEAGNLSGAALDAWINRWCLRVERVWRAGLIYSGFWYLGAKGAKCAAVRHRGWQLWTSAYGSRPVLFAGFTSWRLWQHSDGQYGPPPHSAGHNGNSDMNIANGDYTSWLAWTHYGSELPKVRFASRHLDLGERGTDVVRLQQGINHRLHARGKRNIVADGIYGRDTETAKHYVENVLGFPHVECVKRGCSRHAQTIIDNPHKRPAIFVARAVARAAKH